MVRDGDHVQVGSIADVVQDLPDGGRPVVEGRMHVEIRFAHELLLNRPQRLAPAGTEWGRPGRRASPARLARGRATGRDTSLYTVQTSPGSVPWHFGRRRRDLHLG